jgi:hypothetical protein
MVERYLENLPEEEREKLEGFDEYWMQNL